MRFRVAGIAAALALLAMPAHAQEASAPTARELAAKFVLSGDTKPDDILEMARDTIAEKLEGRGAKLPEDVKAWMRTAFPAAMSRVMSEIQPTLEARLIDAYAAKFTAAELQQVLDFQAEIRQPAFAAAIAESQKETTSAARMEVLRQRLPKEDFEKFIRFALQPPMINVTLLTVSLSQEIVSDVMTRFNEVLVEYCGNAPKGVAQCERQGRPL